MNDSDTRQLASPISGDRWDSSQSAARILGQAWAAVSFFLLEPCRLVAEGLFWGEGDAESRAFPKSMEVCI